MHGHRRRFGILVSGALLVLGFSVSLGAGPASAKTSNPVNVSGKVNNKGTKDISAKKFTTLKLEADDYYFEPTFVKVQPGAKVRITLKNEGSTTHTFTSDALSIDQDLAAGKTARFSVTVPTAGTAFQFHCSFHESMGMQGAFYTKAGGAAQ